MKRLKAYQFISIIILLASAFFLGFQGKQNIGFERKPMDIGIVVSNLEKSMDFYTNVVGMTKVNMYRLPPEIAKEAGFTDGKAIQIINLKLNDETSAPIYSLAKIEGVEDSVVSHSFRPGFRYITVFVNDLDTCLKRIKERNIKSWSKQDVLTAPNGLKAIIISDPDGAMVELMKAPKK